MRGYVILGEQVIPPLVPIVRIIRFPVVLPLVGFFVVVAIQSVGVIVRLHVEHEEGFEIIGHGIAVAINVRIAVFVQILSHVDPIWIHARDEQTIVAEPAPGGVSVTFVRKLITVLVVLHQVPIDCFIG